MNGDVPAYGLWFLAAVNAAVFILFAFSFFKPKTPRDWRSLGAFSAFIVALFAEMYGFPLTLYRWLAGQSIRHSIPSPRCGHLWPALFGWSMNPHWSVPSPEFRADRRRLRVIAAAWRRLHDAQGEGKLATAGPYARLRHPQYAGFSLIMIGFFLQWPTLVTGLMLPVLLVMYWRLAMHEEHAMEAEFGELYRRYAARVPAFIPRLSALSGEGTP